MVIFGYVVYGLGLIIAISWISGTRSKIGSGDSVQIQTLNTLFLFIVSLLLIPLLKWSPLNLLWMYPVSWILGVLSLAWPLAFLSPFGNLIGTIACIGLDKTMVTRNRLRRQKLLELMTTENISAQEARKKLEEKGEW